MILRLASYWTAGSLRLLGARRFTRRLDGTELLAYRLGPTGGEPWLLLHGLGATAAAWYPVLAALRRDCSMVVPELSALGGSRCPHHGLNVSEGSRIAARLIEEEFGGDRVTVAGISLGGWMATRLALDRPELVGRLVIVDGGGYRDQDWLRIQRQVTVDRPDDVDRLFGALFHQTPWILRASRRAIYAAYRSPAVRHVLETTTEAEAFDADDLSRIQAPTGIVWGEHDRLFELEVGRAMAEALPSSDFSVVPGSGHAVHWEKPRRLVAAITSLRRRLPVVDG